MVTYVTPGMGNFTTFRDAVMSGAFGPGFWAFLAAMLVFMIIIFIAFYIYMALAWYSIAKKMKYKHPWLAWIPFANVAMILQLGDFSWGWVFLSLIPVLGWIAILVLSIIATWRIFEKRKYPGWLALSTALVWLPAVGILCLVTYMVVIGMLAWKKK